LPKHGVTCNFSQNLAKRTVTAIQKWKEGAENPRHKMYRLNQLQQDSPALDAFLEAEGKNSEIVLSSDDEYKGSHVNINNINREWFD
jgi:hypothetical protein